MRLLRPIAAFSGVFLMILLATAPARLLDTFLPTDQVRLQGYTGTLWQGSASSSSLAVAGGWLQLGELEWRLSPWSLLILSPRIQLESRWGRQIVVADLQISPTGNLQLRDSSLSFSAELVKQWLPVALAGTLDLLLVEMELRDEMPVAGQGRLVWRDALWIGTRSRQALGDYVLEFTVAAGQQVSGTVSTLSGPVQVEGSFDVQGRKYSVDATLRAEQGFDSELASALQLLAAPVDDGYQLTFSSEF
jgi:general secretion pathway protein N